MIMIRIPAIMPRLLFGSSRMKSQPYSPATANHFDGQYLEDFEDHLPANVFLVPHHGSDNGCTEEVLKAVNPEYSIVSAGKDNKYGHPDKSIVKLLEKHTRKQVYITFEDGSVLFESDGKSILNVVSNAGQDDDGKKTEVKAVAAAFGSRAPVFAFPSGILRTVATAASIPVRSTVSHGGSESESIDLEADTGFYPMKHSKST